MEMILCVHVLRWCAVWFHCTSQFIASSQHSVRVIRWSRRAEAGSTITCVEALTSCRHPDECCD